MHKQWWHTCRTRLISGLLILGPFAVTLVVVLWLFGLLKKLLHPLVAGLFNSISYLPRVNEVHPFALKALVSLLAVTALVLLTYLIGTVGTRVLGKRLLGRLENLMMKVPLAGTLYGATRQVVNAFAVEDRPAYKSVVLVGYPRAGFLALGFLTGYVTLEPDRRMATVFLPTAPNFTTGFLQLIPLEEVLTTDLTVEEAFKMILSAGLVAPETIATAGAH
ncbi:DUF502 domain-containing protein [Planctomycetota bacterium]